MFYHVKIVQRLVGWAVVEGDSVEHAQEIANRKYNVEGQELPEMDDSDMLSIEDADPIPDECVGCEKLEWCCCEDEENCIRRNDNDSEV